MGPKPKERNVPEKYLIKELINIQLILITRKGLTRIQIRLS